MEEKVKVKKPIFKKWWFWVIVVIIVIGLIGGNNSGDNSQKTNAPEAGEQKVQNNDEKNNNDIEPSNKEAKKTEKVINEIGQSLTTDNFIITLEAVNKLPSSDFNKPAEGKEFTELVLIIENISDKDYTVSSLLMFNAYEDGFSINESLKAQIASNTTTMDGALAAGKKIKGKLAYELSTDWKELEIDVDLTLMSLISTDGEIKIILKN